MSVYGNLPNPNIDLDGDISEAKVQKSDIKGYFFLKKNESRVIIKKIFLQLDKNTISVRDSDIGVVKDQNNSINIKGNIYLEKMKKILKTDFTLSGVYDKNNPNIDFSLVNMNFGILENDNLVKLEKFDDMKFNLSKTDDMIVFKNYGKKVLYFTTSKSETVIKFYNQGETVFDALVTSQKKDLNGRIIFSKFPETLYIKLYIHMLGSKMGCLMGLWN